MYQEQMRIITRPESNNTKSKYYDNRSQTPRPSDTETLSSFIVLGIPCIDFLLFIKHQKNLVVSDIAPSITDK